MPVLSKVKAWNPGMKKEKKGDGGGGGRLRIFSSFSRGKAGILGVGDTAGTAPTLQSDPVLLAIKRRDEEQIDGFGGNNFTRCSEDSKRKDSKPRRLPTRSYSLSLQTSDSVDFSPSKWSSKEHLSSRFDSLPKFTSIGESLHTLTNRPLPALPTRGETLPKLSKGEVLQKLVGRGETLPKLSKQIQTSPKKTRHFSKKREKKRKVENLQIEHPHLAHLNPEYEIERFEREFVKPMLDSRKLLNQAETKSSIDLRAAADEQLNTSLPTMHLQLDKRLDSRRRKRKEQRAALAEKAAHDTTTEEQPELEAAERLRLEERLGGEENERVSSSSNSVTDSNYDSGAFSRTSTPEIVAGPGFTSLPPLTSPPLVLSLIRSGDARLVNGQLVLACLSAAGSSSLFDLDKIGQTGGIEITSSFQAIRADIDTVDSQDSLVQNQETDHSGAVTISIGPSTKLHVNEESSLSEKKYVSLSNLESRTRHGDRFISLANYSSESKLGRDGRARTRIPYMGTSRLGTPPMERVNTPPRSLERNRISTVFLQKTSTPTQGSRTDPGSPGGVQQTESFYARRATTFLRDILNIGGDSKDELPRSKDEVRGRRAGSTTSQTSSQESSGVSSCSCSSVVTVNGQHHCIQVLENHRSVRSSSKLNLENNSSCDESLSTCSDCDFTPIILQI